MSAKARFFVPLLWALKMESLVPLEGLGLAVAGADEEVVARRDVSVEVKAALVAVAGGSGLEDLGRGRP